jgi:hypothetical protein
MEGTKLNDLTPIETLALAKAIDPKALKAAREAIPAGTYNFDTTIQLVGSHVVGEDYESIVAQSVPFKDLFLHLASKAPQVMVDAAVREVLSGEAPKAKKPKVLDLIKGLLASTLTTKKGPVTGRGVVSLVKRAKVKVPKKAKDKVAA